MSKSAKLRHNLDTIKEYAGYVLLINLAAPLTPLMFVLGWLGINPMDWFCGVFVASLGIAWLIVSGKI